MIQTAWDRVKKAMDEVRGGRVVIIQDDKSRENEGDLVMAAEMATGENINFFARYGRGLICTPMLREHLSRLHLPQMMGQNQEAMRTAFTVSVDAKEGITTGISAFERAFTIQKLIHPDSTPDDFVRPGHVFPLQARSNGVFERRGQTEASVDLMRLARLFPAAVICEIMNEDGTMARRRDLERFAGEHGLCLITVQDIVEYRSEKGISHWQ
ncbi:3,4-dihydroxy-2-butanone 4-phosphate synthase [Melghirimyces profundicolus]|uniref:3,4-dihydroxy-2-butanone 4-phosphate synthase n=1 Tax=Melghirimyces profundicolus TaxID=1242148 RepID=A0A2T6BSX6_9BACL|nr:3,4-dihydroxy-2-butanone-4-phosphate synthase [Melghirimyces profundicolus]PTX59164.1 3,4-dihydroxy-2-butanone 4-phosphate synthase [Melghirimyces profundicolus]